MEDFVDEECVDEECVDEEWAMKSISNRSMSIGEEYTGEEYIVRVRSISSYIGIFGVSRGRRKSLYSSSSPPYSSSTLNKSSNPLSSLSQSVLSVPHHITNLEPPKNVGSLDREIQSTALDMRDFHRNMASVQTMEVLQTSFRVSLPDRISLTRVICPFLSPSLMWGSLLLAPIHARPDWHLRFLRHGNAKIAGGRLHDGWEQDVGWEKEGDW